MATSKLLVLSIVILVFISLSCDVANAKRRKSKERSNSKMGSLSVGDPVLQFINKNFVTLQETDRKDYMVHYQRVLNELVTLMKKEDLLFEALYSKFYWAGSYYDGLKVGKPEEYDVDMVIKLPIDYATIEVVTKGVERPFVKLRANALVPETFRKGPKPWKEIYKPLDKWTDADGFLLQDKLRTWIESVVSRTMSKLRRVQRNLKVLDIAGKEYLVTDKKTGPAMTFLITLPNGEHIDVDLVPVLEFASTVKWPPAPIRDRPRGQSWFAVPKPNTQRPGEFKPNYWRLGFHDQERELLNSKQHLKPVCKLLKKLRDNSPLFKHLASYYIKTIFLWEEFDQRDSNQWGMGITAVFLKMLHRLEEKLQAGQIDYFWDKQYNLIKGMSTDEKKNVANRLKQILKDIERKLPEDPTILAEYLLTPDELVLFKRNYHPSNDVNNVPGSNTPDRTNDLEATGVEKPSLCCLS